MLPLVLIWLGACRTEVLADEFDQSCTLPDDCALVREGDVCGSCREPGAVNRSEVEAFYDLVTARTRACTVVTLGECPDGDGVRADCIDDTCTVVAAE